MYPHTKPGNPASNNITDVPRTMFFLELKPEVKVLVTWKLYAALRGPKMYSQTKFGIPT